MTAPSTITESGNAKRPASWYGTRHTIAILCFCMNWITYAMRTNLSVGIVAMTDSEASPNPDVPTFDWKDKSTVLSSFYWGYTIPQIFAGAIARRYGPKWMCTASMLVNSLCCFLTPVVAQNLDSYAVMVIRFIQGLAQGFVFPSLHTMLGNWVPPQERSSLGTFVYSGTPFGTIIGMTLTGVISASWVGWPASFYVFGSFGLAWTIFWVWQGYDSPAEHKYATEEEKKYIEASLPPKEDKKIATPWMDIFTSLPLWAIIVANVGFNWGYATLLTQIPSYMNKVMKFDMQANGFLSSAPYLLFWLLCFIGGPSSDYLINNDIMSRASVRKLYNSIGTYIPAVALLVLGFIPDDEHIWSIILLMIAVGASAACFSGFIINHIDLASNHAGVLLGITNCVGNVFSIIAPLVVQAVIYDETDKSLWRIIFIIATCIYVVSSTFYVIFAKGETQYWNKVEDKEKECETA